MPDIYVGIRKETSEGEPESDLRQHVCPSCGNVDILTGNAEMDQDVKPILAGDKLDECCSYYRCAGGFGEFRYRYLPHKCTACGARFTAVKKEKARINKEVVGWFLLFAFIVAAHIALSMVQIAHDVPVFLAPVAITVPLFVIYANILIKIDECTYDKDPGPEYVCENGPSDAAFRRLETAYEKEVEEAEEDEEEDLMEMELLKQRLQAQQHYILQAADPGQIQRYVDGKPLLSFPQPTIRPWDIRPF